MILPVLLLSQLLIIKNYNDSGNNLMILLFTCQNEFVLSLVHQNPILFVF